MRRSLLSIIVGMSLAVSACGPTVNPDRGDAGGSTSNSDVVIDGATSEDSGSTPDVPSVSDVIETDRGTDAATDVVMCATGQTNCSGVCVNAQTDNVNCGACGRTCPSGQVCVAGVCSASCGALAACGTGSSAVCTNLTSDPVNCGRCGNVCPTPINGVAACSVSECRPLCNAGFTACGGACRDLTSDPANCGSCANTCLTGQSCVRGACILGCPPGQTACGSACATLATDNANCGACGRACSSGQVCVAGSCTAPCPSGQAMCNGTCTDTGTITNCGACGRACTAPMNGSVVCASGACVNSCNAGFTNCGGSCVDTTSSMGNCGACGRACSMGQRCNASACQDVTTPCTAPSITCGSACINPQTDNANCGACGRACTLPNTASSSCTGGACVVTTCMPNFADCDGNPINGCEVDMRASATSCGACGRACPSGQVCVAGTCTCPSGTTMCGGVCVNTQSDAANCGACGTVCASAPTGGSAICAAGRCQSSCPTGMTLCGDRCVSTITDRFNCGRCGNACSLANATETCGGGACGINTCNAGFGNCDGLAATGCETNVLTDARHCGACGNACPSGQVCSAGRCGTVCATGFTACGTLCRDLQTDIRTCGACGNACPPVGNATPACTRGACGFACNDGFGDCDHAADNGCEVALFNERGDVNNCGACDRRCTVGPHARPTCSYGWCGIASCDAGYADCNGDPSDGCEVSLQSDAGNCGGCGITCFDPIGGFGTCVAGSCRTSCYSSTDVICGSRCTNTNRDPANCGSCGRVCNTPNATAYCSFGSCGISFCNPGFRDCNLSAGDGCEANLNSDPANCGACGVRCAVGATCSAGVCRAACTSGTSDCGGVCRDLGTDSNNCGGCGVACPSGQVCRAGACSPFCMGGRTNCSGTCLDLQNDPNNCGGCGTMCTMGQSCVAGRCALVCPTGQTNCSGTCRNVQSDAGNCGACGVACPTGQSCLSGTCTPMSVCPTGRNICSGVCRDLQTDNANCGTCGTTCGVSQACVGGACTMVMSLVDRYHVRVTLPSGDPARTITISQWESWSQQVTPIACVRRDEVTTTGTLTTHECDVSVQHGEPAAFNAAYTFASAVVGGRDQTMPSCYGPAPFRTWGTIEVTLAGVVKSTTPIDNGSSSATAGRGCNHWVTDTVCPSREPLSGGICRFP